MAAAATPGLTHGAQITQGNIQMFDGNPQSFPPFTSALSTVTATPDIVVLSNVNQVPPNNFQVAPFLTQNDAAQPVARLTLQTLSGSAVWQGVKLDHWIPAGENGGNAINGKAADISNIQIYYDTNGNGIF